MSRLEEVRETISQLMVYMANENSYADNNYWLLSDISETLAMIYDKMCEKAEGNDDT